MPVGLKITKAAVSGIALIWFCGLPMECPAADGSESPAKAEAKASAAPDAKSPKEDTQMVAIVEKTADFVKACQWTLLLAVLLWCGRGQLREAGQVFIEVYLRRGAKWSIGKEGLSVEAPPGLSDSKPSVVVERPVSEENLATTSLPATPDGMGAAVVASLIRRKKAAEPALPNLLQVMMDKAYPPAAITENFYLVHESKVVRPRTAGQIGLYQVRVYLEADPKAKLGEVTRVTYRLHDTFGTTEAGRVISTADRPGNFAVWLTIYGEFQIVACVERAGAVPLFLARYLDLPGRPPE